MGARWFIKPLYKQFFLPKTFLLKIFLNQKFNEIVDLDLRLVPLHPHDGYKWINCRGKPLKYLTLMKHRRVIQMVFTSWGIPFLFILTFSLLSVRLVSFEHAMTIVGYLNLLFEQILCLMLIFFLTSMFLVVYNLNSRDRTVARQLNFNHRIVKVQTQNKSAV